MFVALVNWDKCTGCRDCVDACPVSCFKMLDGKSLPHRSSYCFDGGTCPDICPSDAECDDGLFCNGAETCDANGTCQPGSDPCTAGETWDEANDVCVAGVVDLDIVHFSVSRSVRVGSEIKRIQLTVVNPNGGQGMRPTTLVGIQNGGEVYNETRMVCDMAGNGRSRLSFPSHTLNATGTINWTVVIDDDDPDNDTATATTRVR